MNEKRNLFINLMSSIVAFIVNIGISFFLTPYIIQSLGVEAYGFVQLGANFINYATLITLAINSMAGRFITIHIHRQDWNTANKYFASVVYANQIVIFVLSIPSIYFLFNIEQIINIPHDILMDVKILFAFLIANFLISLAFSVFSVATFATNRIYLQSLRNIEANIFRSILLIAFFTLFKPAVSYIGIVAFIVLIYVSLFNVNYTRKFLPNIRVKRSYFDIKAIIELVKSGIWNSVVHLGNILLQGLNLLIANLFIGPSAMGLLAVALTIPQVLSALIGTISSVFMPRFTILFAKKKSEELVKSIKESMKILGAITNIPIAILIAYGSDFFSLWIPKEDPEKLQILSVLAISVFIISGSITSLYNIFTVTNKVKTNAIVLIVTGIINIPIVLLLLHYTELGIYAVLGVNSVLSIIRNLLFTAPLGAIYLGLKWNEFFNEIFKSVLGFIIILSLSLSINEIIHIQNWYILILCSLVTTILGLITNIIIILNKQEREIILDFIRRKGSFK